MITGFYAGLLALMQLVLTFRVIFKRIEHKAVLGDAGDPAFTRRIRMHGNFIETVPIALILMLLLDIGGTMEIILHVMGLTLIAGRLLHAYGFTKGGKADNLRIFGMVLTVLVIAVGAILTILQGMPF